jgi:hypothetical protein
VLPLFQTFKNKNLKVKSKVSSALQLSAIFQKKYNINKVQKIRKIHIHSMFQKENIIQDQVLDQMEIVEVEFLQTIMSLCLNR